MNPMADFIQRRCLVEFTTIPQPDLMKLFFRAAYEDVINYGRDQARLEAQNGSLERLIRSLIHGDLVNSFPWLLASSELSALGVMLVEGIDDLTVGRTIIDYFPVPNVTNPTGVMVNYVTEQ